MGFFNFLGTTLSGGGESYSKAVSSELANYRERGMQPLDRRIRENEAIRSTLGTDQYRKLVAANEELINTAGGTMPSATPFPRTSPGFDPSAAVNPPAQPMAMPTTTTPNTTGYAPGSDPMAIAFGGKMPAAAPAAGVATDNSARLSSLNAQIDKSTARLAEIKKERTRLQREYAASGSLTSPDDIKKIDTLKQEAATLTAAITGIQGEVDRLNKTTSRLPAAPAPAAAPAAAAAAAPAPAPAPAAPAPTTPATAITLPSAGPTAGGPTNLVPGPAGPQVTGVPAPQGAWVNKAPVITQYADNIAAAAQVAGVSPEYLVTIAGVESSFDPNAANPVSSARGLFQFIKSTANQYGLTDPTDPVQAIRAVGEFTRDNRAELMKALGRPPSDRELYLAHQQGAGSVAKLLNAGSKLAKDIVGTDAVVDNAGNLSMTGPEFAEHVMQMQDKKAASLGMTPVEALQQGSGNVGLNTQPYINDPNRASLDLQITEYYQQQQQSMFDIVNSELTYAQENAKNLARTMGPMQYREYVNGLRKQQMEVGLAAMQSRTTGAVLYAYQGLSLAQGGQTGLLNLALTEITGVQTEIIPRSSQDGTPLFYSLAIAGQPVGEPMPYDQLVQEVRTRIDRGYAESLMAAQAETAASDKEHRQAIELAGYEAYLRTAGAIEVGKAKTKGELAVDEAAREKGLQPTGEDAPDGSPIFQDQNGQLFQYTLITEGKGSKAKSTPTFEPIY